jgi:hypothetical protein
MTVMALRRKIVDQDHIVPVGQGAGEPQTLVHPKLAALPSQHPAILHVGHKLRKMVVVGYDPVDPGQWRGNPAPNLERRERRSGRVAPPQLQVL